MATPSDSKKLQVDPISTIWWGTIVAIVTIVTGALVGATQNHGYERALPGQSSTLGSAPATQDVAGSPSPAVSYGPGSPPGSVSQRPGSPPGSPQSVPPGSPQSGPPGSAQTGHPGSGGTVGNPGSVGEIPNLLVVETQMPYQGEELLSSTSREHALPDGAIDVIHTIFLLGICMITISLYLTANSIFLTMFSASNVHSRNGAAFIIHQIVDTAILFGSVLAICGLSAVRILHSSGMTISRDVIGEVFVYYFIHNPFPLIPITFLLSFVLSGFAFARYIFLSRLISMSTPADEEPRSSRRSPFVEIMASLITMAGSLASMIGLLLYLSHENS